MSNPLSKLWFNVRKALGCNAVDPTPPRFTATIDPTLDSEPKVAAAGEQLDLYLKSSAKPLAASKTPAKKRKNNRYKFLDKRMERITGAGYYEVGPQGRMDVRRFQHYVTARLHYKFGGGNFKTHVNLLSNRVEITVYGTK